MFYPLEEMIFSPERAKEEEIVGKKGGRRHTAKVQVPSADGSEKNGVSPARHE